MAMGITQALKLQAGPIDSLARLPQQQLINMAQQGRIPVNILPLILNEKAQMAQQAANMQAAQQPAPPSVIEQAMATNAQAEAQQPQQMAGIANLPMSEDLYREENYAGGGIVAFEDGGHVPRYAGATDGSWVTDSSGLNVLADEARPRRALGLGLSDYIRQYQDLTGQIPGRAELERMIAEQNKDQAGAKERLAREGEQNKWMRLVEAGLGIMGGTSPYALTNIGQGSKEAIKGYGEDVRDLRKQEQAAKAAQLALAKQQYELGASDVAGGLGLFKDAAAEEKAGMDRALREREIEIQAKRLNQPPDVIRSAMAIQKPGESLSDALERYSRITEKAPDRFNALSNRLVKTTELWTQSDEYSKLTKALKEAKTEADRAKILDKLKTARERFFTEEGNITKGDIAYLKSVNESFDTSAKVMSMADVKATAKASNKSEEEVIAAAKAKGYTIK